MKVTAAADKKAIARLRSSKRESAGSVYVAGERAGTEFALNEAEFLNLEYLSCLQRQLGTECVKALREMRFIDLAEGMCSFSFDARPGKAESLATSYDEPAAVLERAMREHYGGDIDSAVWLAGFVHGAMNQYSRLAPELV